MPDGLPITTAQTTEPDTTQHRQDGGCDRMRSLAFTLFVEFTLGAVVS